ncbi:spermatogenesis-associated protein 6-like [Procambarus clarkii]|uniref:spermatogenesis-associated protein 6-like n=1 Tax=Procambarus clarkii TaxID=6728 RepID=UPI003744318C
MPQTAKKALKLTTEIDIHAVSCPGVWLPGRGRCSLSVCLLGFHTRTNKLPPVFPLLYHEKFKFERTFVGVRNLSVLERVLEAETVYLELVQEETAGEAVLAVFESSVRDLLFPKPAERLSYSGVDLDLLMEPTRDFPGIISPKIEVSTRTSVSETRTPLHQCSQDNVSFGHAHNRTTKAVYRCGSPEEEKKGEGAPGGGEGVSGAIEEGDVNDRPQLGHASPRRGEYDRGPREDATKPRFVYRRPDDDLLSRIPPSPSRNTRYLGIPSRYLSRSTGNLSDLPRTSIPSRYVSCTAPPGGCPYKTVDM